MSGEHGDWLELSVAADHEAVEAVAEILARVAPGVSIEPAYELHDEGLAATLDTNRPALVRAWLPATGDPSTADAVALVETALGHLQAFGMRPIGELQSRTIPGEDWIAAGRSHFPVLRAGRFLIRPTWRRHRARPGEVVLVIDPGVAFGTGLHPTTRLCLLEIERWADDGLLAGRAVLDVGSGSGILSLAAARLGAGSVDAIDTDPMAVESTRANARRNRLTRSITVRAGSVPDGHGPFDLVVANLVASILVTLAAALHAEVRPGDGTPGSGGRLLASGIIAEREPEVRRALAAAGFHVLDRRTEGDWVALEAERVDAGR